MPMATPNPITTSIPELVKACIVTFEMRHNTNNQEFSILNDKRNYMGFQLPKPILPNAEPTSSSSMAVMDQWSANSFCLSNHKVNM